jgi:hypothetical protein
MPAQRVALMRELPMKAPQEMRGYLAVEAGGSHR